MWHRWVARGGVVALHAAVLIAWWQHRLPPRDDPGQRPSTTIRLIEPQHRAMSPGERPQLIAARPRAAIASPAGPLVDHSAAEQPPLLPAQTQPPAASEPPRLSLLLTLPPGYAASANARRNPALDDPRSNTPRPTLEDRVAAVTGGGGAWVEEPVENRAQAVGALGERRTVMRRGNTCVEVFRSHIADSDPFSRSVAPRAVPMVGKPYTCKGPGR